MKTRAVGPLGATILFICLWRNKFMCVISFKFSQKGSVTQGYFKTFIVFSINYNSLKFKSSRRPNLYICPIFLFNFSSSLLLFSSLLHNKTAALLAVLISASLLNRRSLNLFFRGRFIFYLPSFVSHFFTALLPRSIAPMWRKNSLSFCRRTSRQRHGASALM